MSHHLLIAGTGRAGTSFLVRFFHALGLDTHIGRKGDKASWFEGASAGFEDVLVEGVNVPAPYVVKSPSITEFIAPLLARDDITIDGVIIPIRNLMDAATSRCVQEISAMHTKSPWMARQPRTWTTWGHVPGGVLVSTDPHNQAQILAVGFFNLIEQLVAAEIPMHFLSFPRIIDDANYIVDKLAQFIPAGITTDQAIAAHASVADRTKVRIGARKQEEPDAEKEALRAELERVRQSERECRLEIEKLRAAAKP